ncbi:hypothetical protein DPMN_024227 [Dreissena polymorpha]|uniref:Uncharacterized protein n=1 Tax=Dreissena polymorpha TaxID=45954 RepID=A0A9D4RAL1_DREPO|nr:hypothetical protein DPMN_024227 [Dreissena polymorpha]
MSDIVPFTGTAASADLKHVTDGVAVGVDYTLNLKKSLQKKLDSTDQEDVIIYETGGGFSLLLNTGTKSSCLINGKNAHQFTEIHLQVMLKNTEDILVNDKTTTTDVNNAFKNLLMSISKNESKLSENQNENESDSHVE